MYLFIENLPSPTQAGVGGIVVSIAAFQAVDPGSIPGQRRDTFFRLFFLFFLQINSLL